MNNPALQIIWAKILKNLEQCIKPIAYEHYLKLLVPVNLTNEALELNAPSSIKPYIQDRYMNIISTACFEETNIHLNIIIHEVPEENDSTATDNIDNDFGKKQKQQQLEAEQLKVLNAKKKRNTRPRNKKKANSIAPNTEVEQPTLTEAMPPTAESKEAPTLINPGDKSTLNPKYTFETFVIGNSNSFAHAAALAIAENPAKDYNPFFMYGGVGLGKTHLMHAIGHRILQNNPEKRVLYISCEKFTNELINSLVNTNIKPEYFRQKYRNVDVLLVDDVQFLAKKERVQEEFFHTFNALKDANKQIILSSDRPPKEIEKLQDRLCSRFEGGLIADVQAPDLETRIAILKKKTLLENLNVPDDVMTYIASRIDNNVRELEGALTRVVAYASFNHYPINNQIAMQALQNVMVKSVQETIPNKVISIKFIQETVANHFKLTIAEINGKKRNRSIALPRQIAMYLCRELTDSSLPRIGKNFGGRDHTTVMHACDKIKKQTVKNMETAKVVDILRKEIEAK